MRTELIYSRNRYEDIKYAIDEIQSFRNAYMPLIDPDADNGLGTLNTLACKLRLLLYPRRYKPMMASDAALSGMCKKLEELAEIVSVSNLIESTYIKYNGKMDVHVKQAEDHFTLTVSTSGYSDDIGSGGSVRIPAIKREFLLTPEAVERSFSRGLIDFSWVDSELNHVCRNIDELSASMHNMGMRASHYNPLPALPVFDDKGDKKRDILE